MIERNVMDDRNLRVKTESSGLSKLGSVKPWSRNKLRINPQKSASLTRRRPPTQSHARARWSRPSRRQTPFPSHLCVSDAIPLAKKEPCVRARGESIYASACLSVLPPSVPACLVNLFDTCELNIGSVTPPPPSSETVRGRSGRGGGRVLERGD